MQMDNANEEGVSDVLRASLKAFFHRVLPVFQAQPAEVVGTIVPDVPSTPVVNLGEVSRPERVVRAKRQYKRDEFFKRTKAEIEQGLTIEQAKAARASAVACAPAATQRDATPQTKVEKVVEKKATRFRRTVEEIRLGLTREEAMRRRGIEVAPPAPKKIYVERPVQPSVPARSDLLGTLSPRIQARANVMTTMRRRGVQGAITTEMLDLAAAAVAAGKVTKCEPFVDSDGYDHLNQRETR